MRSLVNSAQPEKSADELLVAISEDELIKNLSVMQAKKANTKALAGASTLDNQEQVRSLVESTKPKKTADELLIACFGREDELLKNLTMIQAKQEKDAQRSWIPSGRRRPAEVIRRRRAREAKAKSMVEKAKKKLRELAAEVDNAK